MKKKKWLPGYVRLRLSFSRPGQKTILQNNIVGVLLDKLLRSVQYHDKKDTNYSNICAAEYLNQQNIPNCQSICPEIANGNESRPKQLASLWRDVARASTTSPQQCLPKPSPGPPNAIAMAAVASRSTLGQPR